MPKKKRTSRGQRKLRLSRQLDTRVIYCGDNLEHLRKLPDGSVDLVYIDPPFNSNRNYEAFWGETGEKLAFDDRHVSVQAYIDFMRPRCVELARVLKTSGTFYYHCDWHAVHYVKVMLDGLFGDKCFLNEIIWKRQSSHNDASQGSKHFGRLHDSILIYTGGGKHVFHHQYGPYDDDYIEKNYKHVEPKTGRRYSLGDITAPGGGAPSKGNPCYEFMGVKRYWRFSRQRMQELHDQGQIVQSQPGAVPRQKRYLDEARGMPVGSIWDDIKPVQSQSRERIGYPTQKPLPLLERIIRTSSNENDIVLDAFCGCGTTLEAAEMLGRQWIGIDISPTACRVMAKRLQDQCKIKQDEALWHADRGFIVRDLPWSADRLRAIPPFEFENWAIIALASFEGADGVPNRVKVGDLGIDGRLYPVSQIDGAKGASGDQLEFTMDLYYPVQVKQKTKAGRPDIDAFETAMRRNNSSMGYFVSFGFTRDALSEIRRFEKQESRVIIPVTVGELLEDESRRRWA